MSQECPPPPLPTTAPPDQNVVKPPSFASSINMTLQRTRCSSSMTSSPEMSIEMNEMAPNKHQIRVDIEMTDTESEGLLTVSQPADCTLPVPRRIRFCRRIQTIDDQGIVSEIDIPTDKRKESKVVIVKDDITVVADKPKAHQPVAVSTPTRPIIKSKTNCIVRLLGFLICTAFVLWIFYLTVIKPVLNAHLRTA